MSVRLKRTLRPFLRRRSTPGDTLLDDPAPHQTLPSTPPGASKKAKRPSISSIFGAAETEEPTGTGGAAGGGNTGDGGATTPHPSEVETRLEKLMENFVFSEEKRNKMNTWSTTQKWKLVQLMEKERDKESQSVVAAGAGGAAPAVSTDSSTSRFYVTAVKEQVPSPKHLSALALCLRTKPIFWVSNFVNGGGVVSLCERLEEALGDFTGSDQLSIQEACLECLRALLCTRHGTSSLLECGNSIPAICKVLDSYHLRIRTQALIILAVISGVNDQGRGDVVAALEARGIERLVSSLFSEAHINYRTAVLILLNSMLTCHPSSHVLFSQVLLGNPRLPLFLEDLCRDHTNDYELQLQLRILMLELGLAGKSDNRDSLILTNFKSVEAEGGLIVSSGSLTVSSPLSPVSSHENLAGCAEDTVSPKPIPMEDVVVGCVHGEWTWGEDIHRMAEECVIDVKELTMMFKRCTQPPQDPVSLLSTSRRESIQKALDTIQRKGDRLKEAIEKVDDSALSEDELATLLTILPTASESVMYSQYDGEVSWLSAADQFLVNMSDIPYIADRIALWHSLRSASLQLADVTKNTQNLSTAFNIIHYHLPLRQVMSIVLAILSQFRPSQNGFFLRLLLSLESVRSTDNSESLMDYLVSFIHENYPALTAFYEDLGPIITASAIPGGLANIETIITEVEQGLETAAMFLKEQSEDQVFCEYITETTGRLSLLLAEAKESFPPAQFMERQLRVRFGNKLSSADILETIAQFVEIYKKAEARKSLRKFAQDTMIDQYVTRLRNGTEFRKRRKARGEDWETQKAQYEASNTVSALNDVDELDDIDVAPTSNFHEDIGSFSLPTSGVLSSLASDRLANIPASASFNMSSTNLLLHSANTNTSAFASSAQIMGNNNAMSRRLSVVSEDETERLSAQECLSPEERKESIARKLGMKNLFIGGREVVREGHLKRAKKKKSGTDSWEVIPMEAYLLSDLLILRPVKSSSSTSSSSKSIQLIPLVGMTALSWTHSEFSSHAFCIRDHEENRKVFIAESEEDQEQWVRDLRQLTEPQFFGDAVNHKIALQVQNILSTSSLCSIPQMYPPSLLALSFSTPPSPSLEDSNVTQERTPFTVSEHHSLFEEKEGPHNMVETNGEIKLASLHRLVCRLTSVRNNDNLLLFTFMLTYRSFMTPMKLLEMLWERYITPVPTQLIFGSLNASNGDAAGSEDESSDLEGLSEEEKWNLQLSDPSSEEFSRYMHFLQTVLLPIRVRVCQILKYWLDLHFSDMREDSVLVSQFTEFIKAIDVAKFDDASHDLQRTLKMKLRSRDTLQMFRDPSSSPTTGAPSPPKGGGRSTNLLQLQLQKSAFPKPLFPKIGTLRRAVNFEEIPVFKWPAKEIARQLTLIEHEFFSRIQPKECLNQAWNKKEKGGTLAPNLLAMIKRSNEVIFWISTEILKPKTPKERAAMISKVVKVAAECHQLRNINSVMEIVGGLHSSPVNRLKKTWEMVPESTMQLSRKLEALVNQSQNYKNMRQALKNEMPPCLPYVGMYLTDLTFIEDGNKDTVEGLLNFFKRRKLGVVIKGIQRFQKPYDILKVNELRSQLVNLTFKSEEELYDLSLELEPRPSS